MNELGQGQGDDHGPSGGFAGLVARWKRRLGWATADRRVEAEGAIEELAATDRGPTPPLTDAEAKALIDRAELHVRADHHDLAPQARPSDQPIPAEPKEGG